MKTWTVHLRPDSAPVLVPEAFSWGAVVLGPVWLLTRQAWIAAVLVGCAETVVLAVAYGPLRVVLALALLWLLGLFGHDLWRWSLARRGFSLAHVVAAPSGDAALVRLLDLRPELTREALA